MLSELADSIGRNTAALSLGLAAGKLVRQVNLDVDDGDYVRVYDVEVTTRSRRKVTYHNVVIPSKFFKSSVDVEPVNVTGDVMMFQAYGDVSGGTYGT